MPFTDTWNAAFEAIPAGSSNASEGDDSIRQLKVATRERLEVDHSMGGDDADGQHKKITFKRLTGDPATVAGKLYLYTKDAEGKVALYVKDEDGNVFRATRSGNFLAGGAYLSQSDNAKGPRFKLWRHHTAPGNGQNIGAYEWWMYNSIGAEVQALEIGGFIVSAAAGDHDVVMTFKTALDGALANRFSMRQGFYAQGVNDPGLGKINSLGFSVHDLACKIPHYGTRATMDPIVANTAITPAAHGIVVPAGFVCNQYFARVLFECKAGSGGDRGYAEGQILNMGDQVIDSGSTRPVMGWADATNVHLTIRGTPFLNNADGSGQGTIDPAKWKAHVDPYVELPFDPEPP